MNRNPTIDRVHAPTKVNGCTKYVQDPLNVVGCRTVTMAGRPDRWTDRQTDDTQHGGQSIHPGVSTIHANVYHRENSSVTQSTLEAKLLSWERMTTQRKFPPLLATSQTRPCRSYQATQTPLSSNPLMLLRCVTNVKFDQNSLDI